MNRRWRQRLTWLWREWAKPILVVVIVLGTFRSAVADWNDVPTGSMKPTILEGDRILVNKLAYSLRVPFTRWRLIDWDDPAPGEIVVCFSPANGDRLVKRVIAGPGDTVALRGNRLMVNGVPAGYGELDAELIAQLDESERPRHGYAAETLNGVTHAVMATPGVVAPRSYGPVTVPPEHYFVMGDNRDRSADSRSFGFVPRGDIIGRSSRVALSLDRDRWYWPRWDRFGRALE